MMSFQFSPEYRASFAQHWLKFFMFGLVLVVLGIIAVSATTMTTLLSVIFLGSLLLMGGIILILDALSFWWNKWSGFFLILISGLIYLGLGIIMIANPVLASASLTLFLGIFYLVIGFFRIVTIAFTRMPNWGWGMLSGLLSFVLGILILSNWPQSGLFIIGLFVGIDLFFSGLAYIMTSLAARSFAK